MAAFLGWVLGYVIRNPLRALISLLVVVGLVGVVYGATSVNNWWKKHQQDKVIKMDEESLKRIQEARDEAAQAKAAAQKALTDAQAVQRRLTEMAHQVEDLRTRANKIDPVIADLRKRRGEIEATRLPPPKDLQEAHSALEALGYGRR